MSYIDRSALTAFFLALASMVATRGLKAFALAEVLAVCAFIAGISILLIQRRRAGSKLLTWHYKLVVVASVVGLSGVVVKLVFVVLGIGTGEHDMANHDPEIGARLLQHIHHLFFNAGFLLMLMAAVGMGVRKLRAKD